MEERGGPQEGGEDEGAEEAGLRRSLAHQGIVHFSKIGNEDDIIKFHYQNASRIMKRGTNIQ